MHGVRVFGARDLQKQSVFRALMPRLGFLTSPNSHSSAYNHLYTFLRVGQSVKLSGSRHTVMQAPVRTALVAQGFHWKYPSRPWHCLSLSLGFGFICQTFFHGSWFKKKEISGLCES